MQDGRVRRALAAMAATDEERAEDARAVIESLTAGEGLEGVGLGDVHRFAWHELPVKWMATAEQRVALLDAAAEALEHLGMRDFAELLRSEETLAIHEAFERSPSAGRKAFQAAVDRSGIDPPDLEDFAWSAVMGWEEASAWDAVQRSLERARSEGMLRPGQRGWRSVARQVTEELVYGSHPELPGQAWGDVILTECLASWVREVENRSRGLHTLRASNANRLLHPIPLPPDTSERLAPLTWLISSAGAGIPLTSAGCLAAAIVRDAWERFGWERPGERPPRSEVDVVEMLELHDLARRTGAVRVRNRIMRSTARGRQMLDDAETAWRCTAAHLAGGGFSQAVAEVVTWLYLGGEQDRSSLFSEAAALLGEAGWVAGDRGPTPEEAAQAWYMNERPLRVLGGAEGDWIWQRLSLNPFGRATLLEQIRMAATGPRTRPG